MQLRPPPIRDAHVPTLHGRNLALYRFRRSSIGAALLGCGALAACSVDDRTIGTVAQGGSTAQGGTAQGGGGTQMDNEAQGGSTAQGGTAQGGSGTQMDSGTPGPGPDASSGSEVNECAQAPCPPDTACVDLAEGYRCDPIEACDGGAECALAPPGWSGPVLFLTGTQASPPLCPGTAPSESFRALSGLQASPATCGCACQSVPLSEQSCGDVQVGLKGAPCGAVPDIVQGTAIAGQCNPMTGTLQTGGPSCCWSVGPSVWSTTADCTPEPSEDVPAIVWDGAHVACALPTSCAESGACVPELEADQALCVYAEGEVECPAEFPSALATFADANDTRSCSACSCGEPTGSCTGEIRIRDGGCTGFPIELVRRNINFCDGPSDELAGVESISVDGFFGPSGGTCAASTSTPQGSALAVGARTVCCR